MASPDGVAPSPACATGRSDWSCAAYSKHVASGHRYCVQHTRNTDGVKCVQVPVAHARMCWEPRVQWQHVIRQGTVECTAVPSTVAASAGGTAASPSPPDNFSAAAASWVCTLVVPVAVFEPSAAPLPPTCLQGYHVSSMDLAPAPWPQHSNERCTHRELRQFCQHNSLALHQGFISQRAWYRRRVFVSELACEVSSSMELPLRRALALRAAFAAALAAAACAKPSIHVR